MSGVSLSSAIAAMPGAASRAPARRAEGERKIGARRPQGVVAARIHYHVLLARHVAVHALPSRRTDTVEMMRRQVVELARQRGKARVRFRAMALRTERVALGLDSAAVGIVAIRAADPALVHLALAKRPVLVVLRELLAVDVVEIRAEGLRLERVVQRPTGMLARRDAAAPRVAGGADVDLVARVSGLEGYQQSR